MRAYPANLKAVGGARTGIAPVNLLDVQDVNGNLYFFADREIVAPSAIFGTQSIAASLPAALAPGQQVAWALPSKLLLATSTNGKAFGRPDGSFGYMSATSGPGADASLEWGEFVVPPLPSDAVIQDVYNVVIASQDGVDGNTLYMVLFGAGATLPVPPYTNFQANNGLGALTLAQVQSATLRLDFQQSTAGCSGQATISFVGVAIYYSSAQFSGGGASYASTAPNLPVLYKPWLVGVPRITFNRSLQTDIGNFRLQNISGTTRSRDLDALLRSSAIEGALFVYRCWQPDAQAPWIEVHGTLTLENLPPDMGLVKGVQAINPAQDDTPLEEYSETCQWNWGLARCGSTQSTECLYSYPTCQVIERIGVAMNNYEKNYGETTANTPLVTINRARKV